jgi:mannose/fructose/N-acetylgalactosamine-specific phosphotransferase system component IID
MYLVAIAWIYVVLMMAVAEAMSPQGSVIGAIFTFLLYGLLPLAIVLYILGTPGRRRAIKAAEAAADAAASAAPDGSGHAAGDTVAAERKEA